MPAEQTLLKQKNTPENCLYISMKFNILSSPTIKTTLLQCIPKILIIAFLSAVTQLCNCSIKCAFDKNFTQTNLNFDIWQVADTKRIICSATAKKKRVTIVESGKKQTSMSHLACRGKCDLWQFKDLPFFPTIVADVEKGAKW